MRTHIDVQLIRASFHDITIIPSIEFRESRQPSGPHPVLKMFVCVQVWWWCRVGISLWIAIAPVWRREDVGKRVLGRRSILAFLTRPRNPGLGEVVRCVGGGQNRVVEGVCQESSFRNKMFGEQIMLTIE
jgi:hypothetical protein